MTAWIVILWSCVLLVVHAKHIRAEMLNSNISRRKKNLPLPAPLMRRFAVIF